MELRPYTILALPPGDAITTAQELYPQ